MTSLRDFIISLTAYVRAKQVVGMFTVAADTLLSGPSVTETHISTLTDSIILLRYVEVFGALKRGMTVLKMRGSDHDRDIRESASTAPACMSASRSARSPASSPATS